MSMFPGDMSSKIRRYESGLGPNPFQRMPQVPDVMPMQPRGGIGGLFGGLRRPMFFPMGGYGGFGGFGGGGFGPPPFNPMMMRGGFPGMGGGFSGGFRPRFKRRPRPEMPDYSSQITGLEAKIAELQEQLAARQAATPIPDPVLDVAEPRVGTLGGTGFGEFPLGTAGPRIDPSDPNFIPEPMPGGIGPGNIQIPNIDADAIRKRIEDLELGAGEIGIPMTPVSIPATGRPVQTLPPEDVGGRRGQRGGRGGPRGGRKGKGVPKKLPVPTSIQRVEELPSIEIPQFDPTELQTQIGGLEERIANITPFDPSDLSSRLQTLEGREIPTFDPSPLTNRLQALENREIPTFDPSPLSNRLQALENREIPTFDPSELQAGIAGLRDRLTNIPQFDPSALQGRIAELEGRELPTFNPQDFRDDFLSIAREGIAIPQPVTPDLSGFARLEDLPTFDRDAIIEEIRSGITIPQAPVINRDELIKDITSRINLPKPPSIDRESIIRDIQERIQLPPVPAIMPAPKFVPSPTTIPGPAPRVKPTPKVMPAPIVTPRPMPMPVPKPIKVQPQPIVTPRPMPTPIVIPAPEPRPTPTVIPAPKFVPSPTVIPPLPKRLLPQIDSIGRVAAPRTRGPVNVAINTRQPARRGVLGRGP